jgi:hypothetical protein
MAISSIFCSSTWKRLVWILLSRRLNASTRRACSMPSWSTIFKIRSQVNYSLSVLDARLDYFFDFFLLLALRYFLPDLLFFLLLFFFLRCRFESLLSFDESSELLDSDELSEQELLFELLDERSLCLRLFLCDFMFLRDFLRCFLCFLSFRSTSLRERSFYGSLCFKVWRSCL